MGVISENKNIEDSPKEGQILHRPKRENNQDENSSPKNKDINYQSSYPLPPKKKIQKEWISFTNCLLSYVRIEIKQR